jgi:hypothetical protein
VPGVWVAGNVTDLAAQVSAAAAAGAVAAARINAELVTEDTHHAVQALHDPFSAQNEAPGQRTGARWPSDGRGPASGNPLCGVGITPCSGPAPAISR